MDLVTVEQAQAIIQSQVLVPGLENIPYELSLGRVLGEPLFADRDLPPFDRSTVDGIAINYSAYTAGLRAFKIKAVQAAGDVPTTITATGECIEIMTGAALGPGADTVVRYEDVEISDGVAAIKNIDIKKAQNVHSRGKDKKQGAIVAPADCLITPSLLGLAASIGKTELAVKKLPSVIIITTGDEMVSAAETPTPYQLRRSNGIVIRTALEKYKISADMIHLHDDVALINRELARCLDAYDVLLISGGVSMGKFDYVPQSLDTLGVEKLFHKVRQRPGKPFWFGTYKKQKLIFAFPGNPVSVFMCLHRYFIPWLENTLGISSLPAYAILQKDIHFPYPLQYFAQVKLSMSDGGQLQATPVETNGSGDFSALAGTDAFMELPMDKNECRKGEVYKVWRYNY